MLKMHVNDMKEAQEEMLSKQKRDNMFSVPQPKSEEELEQDKKSRTSKKSKSFAGTLVIKDHNSDWDVSSDDDEADSDESMDEEERQEAELNQEAEAIADIVLNEDAKHEDLDKEQYQYSVAQKYDLTTRRLTYKKIKYIADEIFLELQLRMISTVAWQVSMFFILFIFFLRMFVHYTGQYIALVAMSVPVERFTPLWYRIDLKYAAFTWYHEGVVVVIGALSNTIFFGFMYLLSYLAKRWCKCFPKIFYRVVCWIGIFAVLDPYIVLVLDCISQNWERGDFFKFYNYLTSSKDTDAKDNKLIGIYLAILIHFIMTVFTGAIFYRYMLFRFMDGRILDLYRRLAGNYKAFFVPQDNEVSAKYLQWVITKWRHKDAIIMSDHRRLLDKFGIKRNVEYIQLFKIEKDMIKKNRMFFKDYDGTLIEVGTPKVFVKPNELRKIKKRAAE